MKPLSHPPLGWVLLLVCATAACVTGCDDELRDPLIEALLPAKGAPGALVDVVGERFSPTTGSVHFGGHPAKVLIWTPQRARVQVPDAGLSGLTLVVLSAEGRPSNAMTFYVVGQPRPDIGVSDLGPIPDLPRLDGPLLDAALDAAPDATPDAVADAATEVATSDLWLDLIPLDSGLDAALTDAPLPDALSPDLAAPDAGAPDAAAPDAGAPDAGAPDAAAPDAAALDAAAADTKVLDASSDSPQG